MVKNEIEQKTKEKVLLKTTNLPQFTHDFFINNDSKSYTTKHNYYIVFVHFLNYIKEVKNIENISSITSFDIESLTQNDIKNYIDILSRSYSENTIKTKINSIKGIFKFLYYNGKINKNIMSQIVIEKRAEKQFIIKDDRICSLYVSLHNIHNEFLRMRNLSIASLIIDTGLSVQDVVELNVSNVFNDNILYFHNDNLIRYILNQITIKYLKQYMEKLDVSNENNPLYITTNNERISGDVVQNIFKKYGNDICPSDFQAKPSIKIREIHNFELIIKPLHYTIKTSEN